jgi:hypothetical protein
MGSVLPALALVALLVSPASADDDVVVVRETRMSETGKLTLDSRKQTKVRHVALLKNTGPQPIRRLRVTVELYDYFGQLLWARTVVPSPSALRPGEMATLSLVTPNLDAYRKTQYRFDYRTAGTIR